ncbi:MAG: hypothetical protein V3T23_11360, partial [Nitrososphaerales archaeon]
MATSNEDFLDAMLRHQIGLMRLSGSIRNDVFALLDATEADLVEQIERLTRTGGLTPANARRIARLELIVKGIRGGAWKDVNKLWHTEMNALALAQPQFVANAIRTVLPVQINLAIPAPELLRAVVTSVPFEGKTLRGWAATQANADISRIMDQVRIGMVQ